ncbi:MAG: hypothetical protein IPK58_22500 [Acidobacteria bacterium]|nr:hypothetical protein [Acidobacteriota bacterium]
MDFGFQVPDSRFQIPDSRFQIPGFQGFQIPNSKEGSRFQDSRIPRVPDWESRIALQSRRVGTICGSGWLDAALPDRSIDTNLSSTIRYRRWY